jgi:hypothetical protein
MGDFAVERPRAYRAQPSEEMFGSWADVPEVWPFHLRRKLSGPRQM